MTPIFRPVLVLENKHKIIFIIEGAEALTISAMLGDRHNVTITTLRTIVREKLKVLSDIPDVPYRSEAQAARWLKLTDPDLTITQVSLEGAEKALAAILDRGEWPEDVEMHDL